MVSIAASDNEFETIRVVGVVVRVRAGKME
jgi:hypothetical protein